MIFAPKDPPAFRENESRSLLATRGRQGWEAEGFLWALLQGRGLEWEQMPAINPVHPWLSLTHTSSG